MAVPLIPLALEAAEGLVAGAASRGLVGTFARSALSHTATSLLGGGDDDKDRPDDTVDDRPTTAHIA